MNANIPYPQDKLINICNTWVPTAVFASEVNITTWDIGPAVRVFANGPGDLGSIPGRVIPKDFKNGT